MSDYNRRGLTEHQCEIKDYGSLHTSACIIRNKHIKKEDINRKARRHDHKVTGLTFQGCYFLDMPSSTCILLHIPFLHRLSIIDSVIPDLTKEVFEGLESLRRLTIMNSGLKRVPGDLFDKLPELEHVILTNNPLEHIGLDIFTSLKHLKLFDVRPFVHAIYDIRIQGSLELLKQEIIVRQFDAVVKDQKQEIENLRQKNEHLEKEKKELRKSLLDVGNLKITVDGKAFYVNEALLVAKSKRIARFVDENPKINIDLKKIPAEIFEVILNFLKNGTLAFEKGNIIQLYEACLRLEIDDLSSLVYYLILAMVNPQTALDVLMLCNKFGVDRELKEKAFEEFKKNFPHQTLPQSLASNPEKLKKLMDAKFKIDSLIREN